MAMATIICTITSISRVTQLLTVHSSFGGIFDAHVGSQLLLAKFRLLHGVPSSPVGIDPAYTTFLHLKCATFSPKGNWAFPESRGEKSLNFPCAISGALSMF